MSVRAPWARRWPPGEPACGEGVKTGVILPLFQPTPDLALAVAKQAAAVGIDGVFCYDHLWPLGQPMRPALAPFPVLAAVAVSSPAVALGTLVARIGLVPESVLVAEFATLAALAPGVLAGLGSGDRLSAAENAAYGLAFERAAERRQALDRCARRLGDLGVTVWIGGAAPATVAVAEANGSAVNLWAASPSQVAEQARHGEVTWAGPSPPGHGTVRRAAIESLLGDLAVAGATWAILAWPAPLEDVAAVAGALDGRH